MDLLGVDLTPAEGKVLLHFVDADVDDDESSASALPNASYEPVPYEGCLAIVMAVGAKVSAKKGQVVVVSPWARDGLKVGENILADAYHIQATVKE
jgi:hypothetical protein